LGAQNARFAPERLQTAAQTAQLRGFLPPPAGSLFPVHATVSLPLRSFPELAGVFRARRSVSR
jgi:hypothetical protein